jgi:hypothetical protein
MLLPTGGDPCGHPLYMFIALRPETALGGAPHIICSGDPRGRPGACVRPRLAVALAPLNIMNVNDSGIFHTGDHNLRHLMRLLKGSDTEIFVYYGENVLRSERLGQVVPCAGEPALETI